MSASLLLAVTLQARASCAPPTFTFVGQPACVTVVFEGDHTRLTSACDGPLLVDRSVVLGSGGVLMPGETTILRDLSAFTLGLDGELHRVVATVDSAPACDLAATAPPKQEDPPAGSGLFARLRAIAVPVVALVL